MSQKNLANSSTASEDPYAHILEDLGEKLRSQAQENGINPDDITVYLAHSRNHGFSIKLSLDTETDKKTKTIKGTDKNAQAVSQTNDLDSRYQADIKMEWEEESTQKAIQEALASLEENKFSNLNEKIELPQFTRSYALERLCKSCQGEGETACGACQGEGKLPCSKCMGSTKMPCHECSGMGQIENSVTQKKTEKNEKGEVVNHTETEKVISPCGACEGTGQVGCGFCNETGSAACDTCGGGKKVKCPPCEGMGQLSDITIYKGFLKPHIQIDADETDIQITQETLSQLLKEDMILMQRQQEGKDSQGEILYSGVYPSADIDITFKEKKQRILVKGYRPEFTNIKPLLDGIAKKHLKKISSAIKGHGSLVVSMVSAMRLRIFQDASKYISSHRPAKAAMLLHDKYALMFSKPACEAIIKGTAAALQNLTKSARWYGLGAIIIGNILFMLIYMMTAWGDTVTLRSGFVNFLDFIVFFGLIGGNVKLVHFASNLAVSRILNRRHIDYKLKVPIGRETYIMGGIAAIIIYGIALSLTSHPPLWALRLF